MNGDDRRGNGEGTPVTTVDERRSTCGTVSRADVADNSNARVRDQRDRHAGAARVRGPSRGKNLAVDHDGTVAHDGQVVGGSQNVVLVERERRKPNLASL